MQTSSLNRETETVLRVIPVSLAQFLNVGTVANVEWPPLMAGRIKGRVP
jgi:hypothetical protein